MHKRPHYNLFKRLRESSYQGKQGVLCFKGTQSGPTLGIGICTHGNEIEGLAVLESLSKVVRGSVVLILSNLDAATEHFHGERSARYLDTNMNRLPSELDTDSREVFRTKSLLPILKEFDYGIDIHSTPGPSEPMALNVKGNGLSLVPTIPIQIDGMLEHQEGVPLSSFFGGKSVVGVEAGQQGTEEAWNDARKIFEQVLAVLGMSDESPTPPVEKSLYRVFGSVRFPNPTYQFLPRLLTGSFSSLRKKTCPKIFKGEIIARGEGPDIRALEDSVLLFPRREMSDLTDEAAFLAVSS